MSDTVALRDVVPADREFLLRVYASTRAEELARVSWSDAQKEAFVAMQFEAQDLHYRREFARATFSVVVRGEQAIGRMYVAREHDALTLIELTLLPEFRGAGIGTELLGRLLDEARTARLPLRLHVDAGSPALRWYECFGFATVDRQGYHVAMEWRPPTA